MLNTALWSGQQMKTDMILIDAITLINRLK